MALPTVGSAIEAVIGQTGRGPLSSDVAASRTACRCPCGHGSRGHCSCEATCHPGREKSSLDAVPSVVLLVIAGWCRVAAVNTASGQRFGGRHDARPGHLGSVLRMRSPRCDSECPLRPCRGSAGRRIEMSTTTRAGINRADQWAEDEFPGHGVIVINTNCTPAVVREGCGGDVRYQRIATRECGVLTTSLLPAGAPSSHAARE